MDNKLRYRLNIGQAMHGIHDVVGRHLRREWDIVIVIAADAARAFSRRTCGQRG